MTMMPDGREIKQRRYLVVTLREGWCYDPRQRRFYCSEENISLKDVVPSNTRVALLAPDLAARQPTSLSRDKRVLASTLNIFLPEPEDPDDILDAIRSLDCVDKAWVSPDVSLPTL